VSEAPSDPTRVLPKGVPGPAHPGGLPGDARSDARWSWAGVMNPAHERLWTESVLASQDGRGTVLAP